MAANDEWGGRPSREARGAATAPTGGADSPLVPRPGDVLAGKYRIERQIGEGGMGTVYEATHLVMESPVAVKVLCPDTGSFEEMRARFLLEVRAAARIRHPNVVQVFDVGEQDGALIMVMELLEGETLDVLIRRQDMPLGPLLQLLVQAMWGVRAAHEQGIVHRDIKPANIFVVEDRTQPSGLRAKVLDFGISKVVDDGPARMGLTKSGVSMGTPAYMSPEQVNDARDVDARTDVYAFGVLMYRALTGRLPFEGKSFAALSVAIATHSPPAPRELRADLPEALSDSVMRAMARDRQERYGSLQELLEALSLLSPLEEPMGLIHQPVFGASGTTPQLRPEMTPAQHPTPAVGSAPPWRTQFGVRSVQVTQEKSARWHPWTRLAVVLLAAAVVVIIALLQPFSQASSPQPGLASGLAPVATAEPMPAGATAPDPGAGDEATGSDGRGSDLGDEPRPAEPVAPKPGVSPLSEATGSARVDEPEPVNDQETTGERPHVRPAAPRRAAAGRRKAAPRRAHAERGGEERAEPVHPERAGEPPRGAPEESGSGQAARVEPESSTRTPATPDPKRVEHRSGGLSPNEW